MNTLFLEMDLKTEKLFLIIDNGIFIESSEVSNGKLVTMWIKLKHFIEFLLIKVKEFFSNIKKSIDNYIEKNNINKLFSSIFKKYKENEDKYKDVKITIIDIYRMDKESLEYTKTYTDEIVKLYNKKFKSKYELQKYVIAMEQRIAMKESKVKDVVHVEENLPIKKAIDYVEKTIKERDEFIKNSKSNSENVLKRIQSEVSRFKDFDKSDDEEVRIEVMKFNEINKEVTKLLKKQTKTSVNMFKIAISSLKVISAALSVAFAINYIPDISLTAAMNIEDNRLDDKIEKMDLVNKAIATIKKPIYMQNKYDHMIEDRIKYHEKSPISKIVTNITGFDMKDIYSNKVFD